MLILVGMICNAQEKVTVSTARDFVDAISSNKIIEISENSNLILSDLPAGESGKYYKLNDVEDGKSELVIMNVSNLTIKGLGTNKVKITTKPEYGEVLIFENCNNITIENIYAGHGPRKGLCSGGVFCFNNSKNIVINNCTMYGCGTCGIDGENVTGLKCNNSEIKGCSYGIVGLIKYNNVEFNDCKFYDNVGIGDLFYISNCMNVKVTGCTIENNTEADGEFSSLINAEKCISVVFKNCRIENNATQYLGKLSNSFTLENSTLDNNDFKSLFDDGDSEKQNEEFLILPRFENENSNGGTIIFEYEDNGGLILPDME